MEMDLTELALAAISEVEASVADVQGEFPDTNPDDIFHDIAIGKLMDLPAEVAAEFCRMTGIER